MIARRHARLEFGHALLGVTGVGQPLLHVFPHGARRLGIGTLIVQGHALATRNRHRPGVGILQPREDSQQRRLARAVPSRHGKPVPGTEPERDVREQRARSKRLGQPRHLHRA
jgi:hypothetical protein